MAHQGGAYSLLDEMLVHCRVTPSIKFAGTHLYTWVDRGTVRVKRLAQEHKMMSPARARTRTARSGDKRINHAPTITKHPVCCKLVLGLLNHELTQQTQRSKVFNILQVLHVNSRGRSSVRWPMKGQGTPNRRGVSTGSTILQHLPSKKIQ